MAKIEVVFISFGRHQGDDGSSSGDPEVGPEVGPEMVRRWSGDGPEMARRWSGDGPEMVRVGPEVARFTESMIGCA